MSEKRRDNRNRILREGEYQRKDGRYRFRYIDEDGKEKNVYSWRLDKNDPMPKGKKREPSLREKEKQIEADLFDRIVTNGGNYTVLELVEKYVSLKTGVRHNTVAGYKTVINMLKKESFGNLRIDKVRLSDAKAWLIKLQQIDGRGYSSIHSIRGVLRPAFQMAVDDDLLRKNPFEFELASVIVNDSVTREAITRKQQRDLLKFIQEDKHFSRYYDAIYWVDDIGPKKLADSTFCRDLQDIRRILPALGNYKLTDLRKEVIRDFYEEMRCSPRLDGRGNLSEKTVEGLHNTLCGILSAAVDEGYLTHNPAWRCYKPKGQKKERPVADEETVKKLITAFEGQSTKYETYFKLVLATGLRRGEACGLKWSDINWRKRTIHVQRGVVKLSHQESITKDPKTSSGDRMVYLSKEMCQLLKAWRKECEWDRQQTANETVDEDDYLFRQPNGKPMCPSTFTYRFKLILKANNLPLDLNVHSLRHTNASLLIAQGVDVRTVASLLGHAQASTTLDIYAHAFDKNKRKAQEKLGKAIGL